MDKYIDHFPDQLEEAIAIGRNIPMLPLAGQISEIIISGMGGSGIGGALVKSIAANELSIPIELISDYSLPAYADDETLVICSSYSGNTEETLSVFDESLKKNCRIICITTGGKLKSLADQNNKLVISIPEGRPPRTSLGYSMVAQFNILIKADLLPSSVNDEILKAAELLREHKEKLQISAKALATEIQNTIPLIYASPANLGIATRWKQQLNENSKMHCFVNSVPEMNHNELVAFYFSNPDISVIFLRDENDHPQIKKRFDLCRELMQGKVKSMHEVKATGGTIIEKMFYLIHLGDWLSYYLSQLKNVDPIGIAVLDQLKKSLGQ